jgi:hypothetical protein
MPSEISYQDYLGSLDRDRGLLLEMIFRDRTFKQMSRWQYDNPRILELRYEQIAGNEEAACASMFDHYGFDAKMRGRGLELAREFGLNNQTKREGTHIRSGQHGQWADHFSLHVKSCFKETNGDLLVKLGYEDTRDW